MAEPRQLAEAYFRAWQNRDAEELGDILSEDVTFRGPLGTANGRDECIAGLLGMARILTGIEVQARVVEGLDVITWFLLHTTLAPPIPTANWSHIEGGLIVRIRAAFDPRQIVAAQQP